VVVSVIRTSVSQTLNQYFRLGGTEEIRDEIRRRVEALLDDLVRQARAWVLDDPAGKGVEAVRPCASRCGNATPRPP
jgi:hypothetical protein